MIALPFVNDYQLNRDTYTADSATYSRHYVERLSDDETIVDFEQRLRVTPSPSQAKQLANRILSGFRECMAYAVRYGAMIDHIESGRGVDNCGSTIAEYVQSLAKEVVIQGRVGVSIDRVQKGRPYCVTICAEKLIDFEYADPQSPSVLKSVEWDEQRGRVRFWIDDETGKVLYKIGESEQVDSMLSAIPFVVIEGESVIARIAQHQRTLTNLLSVAAVENPGLLEKLLVRQRDSFNNGSHQRGIDDEILVGRNRGLFYSKGEQPPAFVGPPAAPAAEARQVVQSLIEQMESLAGLSGDTEGERAKALAAAVGSLGATLAAAERNIWLHMEAVTPSALHARVVKYPLTWQSQTEAERQADVESLYANAQRASGRTGIEEATVLAVEQHFAGQPSKIIQKAVDAIRSAPCLLNDDTSIIRAYEAKILDTATACDALGCKPEVATKAIAEAAERAKQLAEAAAMAAATKQADRTVGGVGSDRDAELAEKQLSQVEGEGDTRGESK